MLRCISRVFFCRLVATLETLLGMLRGTGQTNWPVAEWRVPINDPISLFEVATCYELTVTVTLNSLSALECGTWFLCDLCDCYNS